MISEYALDTRTREDNITKRMAFLEIKLRSDAARLPMAKKFDVLSGHDTSIKEYQDSAHPEEWVLKTLAFSSAVGVGIILVRMGDVTQVVNVGRPKMRDTGRNSDINCHWVRLDHFLPASHRI
jgi:hypothetical protein